MGPGWGSRAQGARSGNRAAQKKRAAFRPQADDHAGGIRPMGPGAFVFFGFRAGDFHVGQVRLSARTFARSRALRSRPVATKNPHPHFESHPARYYRATPTRQFTGASVEILLRDANQASSPNFPAFRQRRRIVLRRLHEISHQRTTPGFRLRRMSACGCSQAEAENNWNQADVSGAPKETERCVDAADP